MENFYMAMTFLLFGMIIGFIIGCITIYKYYGLGDPIHDETQELFPENITPIGPFPLDDLINAIKSKERAINPKMVSIKNFENHIDSRIAEHKKEEEWTEVSRLTNFRNDLEEWFEPRKEWFISKIGTMLTPNQIACECQSCQNDYENGCMVDDEQEALKLFLHEIHSKVEKKDFEYIEFDGRP